MEEDSPEGWFYLTPDGVENGPLNFRIIRAHLRLGTLPSNIPVWREGLSDWTEAKNVSLFSNFGHGVPSSPAVEETVQSVNNDIYDAKTNYVTDGGTPLFPSTPRRHVILHQNVHEGQPSPLGAKSRLAGGAGEASSDSGEWYYSSNDKQPRGPLSTAQLTQLIRKGIVDGHTWVWSQTLQPSWAKISTCERFRKPLSVIQRHASARRHQNGRSRPVSAAATPASAPAPTSAGRSGGPPTASVVKRRDPKHSRRHAGKHAAPAASPSLERKLELGLTDGDVGATSSRPSGASALSREREDALAAELDAKDQKLGQYRSKVRELREEIRRRDAAAAKESRGKGRSRGRGGADDPDAGSSGGHAADVAGANGGANGVVSAADADVVARLHAAEARLREQDDLLAKKNQEIQKLEVTVAETDSELTKARIALSKELSWLLEENAS